MVDVAFLTEMGEAKAWVNLRRAECIVFKWRLSNYSYEAGRASWQTVLVTVLSMNELVRSRSILYQSVMPWF